MIIREKPRAIDLIFALRGSILPRVLPKIVVLVLVSSSVVWLHKEWGWLPEAGPFAFTVFGIALSLALGFRNNTAYDRWWLARTHWGGLLTDARTMPRELEMFLAGEDRRREILRLVLAFLHLHRADLRQLPIAQQGGPQSPDAALDQIATLLSKAREAGAIDSFGLRSLSERIGRMAIHQTANERIANTPLPYVYSLLIYRSTWAFGLLLPLGLVGPTGWLTPLFMALFGYMFFGLAEVTEELSDPFGPTPNALALDAICRAAEISLAPHLGETAPPPLAPTNFFLS